MEILHFTEPFGWDSSQTFFPLNEINTKQPSPLNFNAPLYAY
jgi:hypothetical protein